MTQPVWGCPWHGKVQGGQLQLPNAQVRAWPQPPASYDAIGATAAALPDTWGIAHRLALPGVPAPERTPEEQADDAAAGRQWRNEAVLSGARQQLYGRPLDGWIYVDPDGVRWRVRCPGAVETTLYSMATPLNLTVTLERFGEFGGPPEAHQYQVSSEWGLGTNAALSSIYSGRLMVDAIRADGGAAILMNHLRIYSAGSRVIQREPLSFLELSISGPGAAAAVSLAVARSWNQINRVDPAPVPIEGSNPWLTAIGTGQRASHKTLAVWYAPSGSHVDVEFRLVGDYVYNIPLYDGSWSYFGESQAEVRIQLAVGGVVTDEITASFRISATASGGRVIYDHSVTVDGVAMVGSSDIEFSGAYSPYPGVDLLGCMPGADRRTDPAAQIMLSVTPAENPALSWGSYYYAEVLAYPYSRQVFGLEIMTNAGAYGEAPRNWQRRPPVTPSGLAVGSTQVATTNSPAQYYGAWDPYSGACSWHQLNPVCYV